MDADEPHKIWYYSRGGEKRGPVSFTELRAKAKDASLNPRLDMVWCKGMGEWKPAGDIEGLFKRRPAPEPTAVLTPTAALTPTVDLAPAADPYEPPQEETVEDQMAKQGSWPGARRRSYLLLTLVFPVLWKFTINAGAEFLTTQFGPQIVNFVMPGLILIPLLVIIFISLKRLVNLGMSRWWLLGNLVPFLNVWIWYRCFACPAGYAYHKKLDSSGVVLAITFWVAIIAAMAVLYGSSGTPELRRQLHEIIRAVTALKP